MMEKKINSGFSYLALIIVIAIILVAAVIGVFAYLNFSKKPASQNSPTTAQNKPAASSTTATQQSLGGQIYEQSANPLGNKLPDTNPAKNSNPIQNLNVNPF